MCTMNNSSAIFYTLIYIQIGLLICPQHVVHAQPPSNPLGKAGSAVPQNSENGGGDFLTNIANTGLNVITGMARSLLSFIWNPTPPPQSPPMGQSMKNGIAEGIDNVMPQQKAHHEPMEQTQKLEDAKNVSHPTTFGGVTINETHSTPPPPPSPQPPTFLPANNKSKTPTSLENTMISTSTKKPSTKITQTGVTKVITKVSSSLSPTVKKLDRLSSQTAAREPTFSKLVTLTPLTVTAGTNLSDVTTTKTNLVAAVPPTPSTEKSTELVPFAESMMDNSKMLELWDRMWGPKK